MLQNFKTFCLRYSDWVKPDQVGVQHLPEIIADFTQDSRQVTSGSLFFASRGQGFDGQAFVQQALSAGAVAAVVPLTYSSEAIPSDQLIFAKDPNELLALWAREWYGRPDETLCVIGVTGTNGKTSVCQLTETILNGGEVRSRWASLGTLGLRVGHAPVKLPPALSSANTTPDPKTFYGILQFLKDQGYAGVVCEVSSHGIALRRIAGCRFQSAAFTNISRDHLDFHRDLTEYLEVKTAFLREVGKRIWVNGETVEGQRVRLKQVETTAVQAKLLFEGEGWATPTEVLTPLSVGLFPENVGLALGLASEWMSLPQQIDLRQVHIPGRCELYLGKQGQVVVIDYAHTPEALAQVLQRLRKVFKRGRLWVVVGCGGDRDRGKRPLMGQVACAYGDHVVFTSDNPRWEDPLAIIQDMVRGISEVNSGRVSVIVSREEALQHTLRSSEEGDIVLVAGKGHEPYQIIAGKFYPFSDLSVCQPYLVSTPSPISSML